MRQIFSNEVQHLEKALAELDFPTNRENIIACAEDNGIADDLIVRLNDLPDEEYASTADIMAYLRS